MNKEKEVERLKKIIRYHEERLKKRKDLQRRGNIITERIDYRLDKLKKLTLDDIKKERRISRRITLFENSVSKEQEDKKDMVIK